MRTLIVVLTLLATAASARVKLPPPSRLSMVQAQCGRCACGSDADCGAGGSCAAGVCAAGDVARVSCVVAADCAAGQACSPTPHVCSATFRVGGGTATLKSSRQPAPTCPKTGERTENNGGDVRLTGVTSGAEPYTGTLAVDVVLKTSFGPDPESNCLLSGLQVEFTSLDGTLNCRAGKCKGVLHPFACLPKECANTPITSELSAFVVKEPSGARLATPGLFLVPAASDAP
jgi:hypothetical protein